MLCGGSDDKNNKIDLNSSHSSKEKKKNIVPEGVSKHQKLNEYSTGCKRFASSRASRKVSKCGYLFVAPDWDFNNPLYRTKAKNSHYKLKHLELAKRKDRVFHRASHINNDSTKIGGSKAALKFSGLETNYMVITSLS
ncbi:hypothetical protein GQX74_001478 [Glossina fuscipes]|nr:hypothetical protein GQX74_001478 [Glossina fuscipes]